MTITLKFSEQQAERLRKQAEARQQSVEAYVLDAAEQRARHERGEAFADELARLVPPDTPPLPEEAFQRASFYDDEA